MLFKKKKEYLNDGDNLSSYPYFPEVEQIKQALDAKNEATETYDLARMPLGRSRKPVLPEIPELPEAEETESEKKGIGMPELPELPEEEEMTIPEFPKKEGKKPKTLGQEKKTELRERVMKEKRPLFIKIDKFKEILASIKTIEQKVKLTSDIIQRLKKIRDEESEIMDDWEAGVQELKAKLGAIEKELSEIEE